MPRKKRPSKPYPDFPLTPHPSGQWCKKIRGQLYYFGKDADAALRKYLDQRDDLQAGRIPRASGGDMLSLRDLCNHFLTAKRIMVDSQELSPYTFADCYRICQTLIEFFGKDCVVANLRPADFGRLRASIAKDRGKVTLHNAIVRTRSVFNWAMVNKHLIVPMDFGDSFNIPSKKHKRRERNEARRQGQGRSFTADALRKIISEARQPLKAMILLGINCGFGQSDCAALPLEAIDLQKGWINFPRVKTETDRRCPLWPETLDALKEWLADRPEAKSLEDTSLVFLTSKGNRWIQKGTVAGESGCGEMYYFNDNVAKEFNKLLFELGLKRRGSFYNLRHCFRTAAGAAKDRDAIDVIMGHVDPSMGEHYVESFDDDRLVAVVDHVRNWLFTEPQAEPSIIPFKSAML
jgi:integrase